MAALSVVGSDLDHFGCPVCGCHDRERHLVLYLKRLGMLDKFRGAQILHFAPERCFSKLIAGLQPERYIKGDLFPAAPGIEKMDMLAIPYESETFDYVIANHVLEHVADDLKALSELRRVLKVGGVAILQTPYSAKLQSTFVDAGVDDHQARLHAYGQEDHVRLYGSDIFMRFESVGFKSRVIRHMDVISDVDPARYGVNVEEPLFLFERAPT